MPVRCALGTHWGDYVLLANADTTGTRANTVIVFLRLVTGDGGDNHVVEAVDEIGLHIRRQIVDRFERVVQASVHCVERSHTLIGVVDFVVAPTEFSSVRAAAVFCAGDIGQPAGEITLPLLSQVFIIVIFVVVSRLPGVEVGDRAGALGDRLRRVEFRLEACLEGVFAAVV